MNDIILFNIQTKHLFLIEINSNGISTPIQSKTDYSYDNPIHHDDDDLSEDGQEKQFENEIEDIDGMEQIQAEMNVPPGAAETIQQTSGRSKRFLFLFKTSVRLFSQNSFVFSHSISIYDRFFRKSKKPEKPSLKLYEVYRYADKLDICLMIIGTIAG